MEACNLSSIQIEYKDAKWPVFQSLLYDKNSANLTLLIPETLQWFKGHFPQQAVLPGVVQTHWAALLSIKLFSIEHEISQIINLKFKNIVTPNEEICLVLTKESEKKTLFTYSRHDEIISSGTFKYISTS